MDANEWGLTPADMPMVMTAHGPEQMMTVRAMLVMVYLLDLAEMVPPDPKVRDMVAAFQGTVAARYEVEKATKAPPRCLADFLFEEFAGAEVAAEIDKATGMAAGEPRDLLEVLLEAIERQAVAEAG